MWYRHPSQPDHVFLVPARDGWKIALSRFQPRNGAPARNHPVLLLHGLGSNRIAFDYPPSHSLARALAERGFEAWAVELRGHGQSELPRRKTKRAFGWCFDDYLNSDLPAAIEHILAKHGATQLHWIGHSMGGILLYAWLACQDQGLVRSGVTVGSSLDYSASGSHFHRLTSLLPVGERLASIPLGVLGALFAPLAGRRPNVVERFNYWEPNMEPEMARVLHATAFHPVSAAVMVQLAGAFRTGGLCSQDGSIIYGQTLGNALTPVLAIAGDRDMQCPPEAVRATFEALGGKRKRLLVFGKEQGYATHYGHWDLLLGKSAPHEVYPSILGWLEERDR